MHRVLSGETFTPLGAVESPEPRDRALANRLVTIALRHHGQIDIVIAESLDRGMPRKSGGFEAILRLGIAQLVWLPELGAHSALFLAVEAIKRDPKARHLAGLLNAALRTAQANSARYGTMPDRDALPPEVAARWDAAHGEGFAAEMAIALIAGPTLDLTVKAMDPDLLEALPAKALIADTVRVGTRDRTVDALPGYDDGRWWVQDAAAAMPARLIRQEAGARVLDICAAPGGKTAQLIKAGYRVTALDSDADRMVRLGTNLERLGYEAEMVIADAADFVPDAPFDAILLDAPCSATGTFRRHPEVIWRRTAADIAARVIVQRRLLANAVRCLAPGGTLVYCVCSLEPEEGEAQFAWVLETFPNLAHDPVAPAEMEVLPLARTPSGTLRLHAGLIAGGMDGFFAARFRSLSGA